MTSLRISSDHVSARAVSPTTSGSGVVTEPALAVVVCSGVARGAGPDEIGAAGNGMGAGGKSRMARVAETIEGTGNGWAAGGGGVGADRNVPRADTGVVRVGAVWRCGSERTG